MSSLKGKRAVVTGGSRGIGAAIVRRLASEGADVAFTYVSRPEQAEQTVASAAGNGAKILSIQADGADADAVTFGIDRAAGALGGLDILVNNAGIAIIGPLESFTLEDFDRTVAINIRAVFVATTAAIRHMGSGGRIINIGSSSAERIAFIGGGVYAMSKSALIGLTKGLARDLGPRGITVNNVQPGPVATEMNPATGPFAESLHQLMAIPRHADAGEIASLVAYLAGSQAAFITGASLNIDGGFTA